MTRTHPFTVALDEYALAGSITLPDHASAEARVPMAVFLGGPGPTPMTRHTSDGSPEWPLTWSAVLAHVGMGALSYDQRGGGRSTGQYADANRLDLLTEAREAVAMAKVQPETARLAAIGWGDGATFALELAAEGLVDAAVLLAPPYRTAEARYEEQVRQLAQRGGFSERVVGLRLKQWRAELEAVANRIAQGETKAEHEVGGQTVSLNLERFLQTAQHDPGARVPAVQKPVLILHGEADAIIRPEESALLASALQCPVRRITYPRVQHFLHRHPEAAADAAQWLVQTLLPS